jgi:hypothetical protein
MSARTRAGRPARRDLVLALEGLESRELLSYYAALYAKAGLRSAAMPGHLDFAPQATTTGVSATTSAATATATSGGLPKRIPPILRTLANINYPPGTSPQPTNRELVREAISANFSGSYHAGPGRFSDQAMTISLTAFGGANFSYHTNLTGVVYTPVDPATNSAVGIITLFPRNVLTSGAQLTYDLTATGYDRHGLPNVFSTLTDQGQSSGFALSSGPSPGSPNSSFRGIANIHYFPEQSHNGVSSGKFYLTLRALQYTSGTINPIGVPGNLAGPGALTPQRLSTLGTNR